MAKGSSTRTVPSRKRRATGRNLGRAHRTQAGHTSPTRRRPAANRDAVPACSPGVDASRPRLGPAPAPHRFPQRTPTGSRQGEATRSHATEPLQGSRFTGSGVARHPREALAALGIPGLHAASPAGLSCDSTAPHQALGAISDPKFQIADPRREPAGSMPPPTAEATAPTQRRPTRTRCAASDFPAPFVVSKPGPRRSGMSALPSPLTSAVPLLWVAPFWISVKSASHQRFTLLPPQKKRTRVSALLSRRPLPQLHQPSTIRHQLPTLCEICGPSVLSVSSAGHFGGLVCGSRATPRRFDGAASPGLGAGPWRRTSSGCAGPGSTT